MCTILFGNSISKQFQSETNMYTIKCRWEVAILLSTEFMNVA